LALAIDGHRLAPVTHREGQHHFSSVGTGGDHPSRTLGRVSEQFLLRSDNGLVFPSRYYTRLVRSYGVEQEFITPHCPQQNAMVERVIRTLRRNACIGIA